MYNNDLERGEGLVNSHTKSQYNLRKSVTFSVMKCLYADYGSFPFVSRYTIKRVLQVIYDNFSRFGLKMHVVKSREVKIKASKTECFFYSMP